MKNLLAPVLLALLLAAAGAVCWIVGESYERVARVKGQVATMDYRAVADGPGLTGRVLTAAARVPVVGAEIEKEIRDDRARANYWLGRYQTLTLQRDASGAILEHDPQILLLAANAAYRANRIDPKDKAGSVQRLEIIVTDYADVLKSSPDLADAAYNYEFAARLRAALANGRPGSQVVSSSNDDKGQAHGIPGGPPKKVPPNQFNVNVPKTGNERTDSQEAGKGGTKVHKG